MDQQKIEAPLSEHPAGDGLAGDRSKVSFLGILLQGFVLARRHWPFVLWAYAINLVFGLLAAVPFTHGLSSYLDHSFAAEKIAGTLNLGSLTELAIHLHQADFFPAVFSTAAWLNWLQLLVLFFLYAGAVFVYVSAEPGQMATLLRGSIACFWSFVRAAILAGCVAVFTLGLLFALRAAVLARLASVYVERPLFLWSAFSAAVIFLVALLLRLWFDLVEVYVVRNIQAGELRVRRALLPACRLLFRRFPLIVGSFLLVGLAGTGALGLCLLLWQAVPAGQVWLAFLLGQAGLFLLLSSRFWQRGLEAAFVLAADPLIIKVEVVDTVVEDAEISLAGVAGISGLSEPTLSELVLKLRTEPWAPPLQLPSESTPGAPQDARPGSTRSTPENKSITPLELHATKFPLGGSRPIAPPPKPEETAAPVSEAKKPPLDEKPKS